MGKMEQVADSATTTFSTVSSTVVSQASGVIQNMQKQEEGVQEGAIQQPVYVESAAAALAPVVEPVPAPVVEPVPAPVVEPLPVEPLPVEPVPAPVVEPVPVEPVAPASEPVV